MSTIREITSVTDFDNIVTSLPPSTLLVLFFHAPWASPCGQLHDFLSKHSTRYSETSPICFLAINADDMYQISERYEVTAVPFLALAKDGKVLETISGADTVHAEATIERYAGISPSSNSSSTTTVPPPLKAEPSKENATLNLPPDTASDEPKPQDSDKKELFKRLRALVIAAPVMLFMKGIPSEPQCGFSRQMVALLRQNNVRYGFFNILADDEVRQGLKELAEWPTYPQLWVKGELIGGLDIVSPNPLPFARFVDDYWCIILTQFDLAGQGRARIKSGLPQTIRCSPEGVKCHVIGVFHLFPCSRYQNFSLFALYIHTNKHIKNV